MADRRSSMSGARIEQRVSIIGHPASVIDLSLALLDLTLLEPEAVVDLVLCHHQA
jgi:hypothetical protein